MKLHSLVILSLYCTLITSYSAQSQSSSDALRYSDVRSQGTARSIGVNNSFGAIGADQSAIGINPAGLGLFRRSDLSFGFYLNNNQQTHQMAGSVANPKLSTESSKLNLSNLGLVISTKPNHYSKWKQYNIFIGYNKTASYKENLQYDGQSEGSILHRFLENSIDPAYSDGRGLPTDQLDEFETKLAYETGALYDVSTDTNKIIYTNDLLSYKNAIIPKKGSYAQKGTQGNLSFALGANYNEIIILGASLDIISAKYEIQKSYEEYTGANQFNPFVNLKFSERLNSEVNGVKGSLGVILKPSNNFRLGISWHSPSLLTFVDNFNTTLKYSFVGNKGTENYESSSPDGYFDYKIIVPSRWIGSFAFISKLGFINVDVDYFTPGQTKFKFKGNVDLDYEAQLNSEIKKNYTSVVQTRVGLEIPLHNYRIRFGAGFLPSPYANESVVNKSWSTGFGYRAKYFYWDLGFINYKYSNAFIPFNTGGSDFNNDHIPDAVSSIVQSNVTSNEFLMTFGFKF